MGYFSEFDYNADEEYEDFGYEGYGYEGFRGATNKRDDFVHSETFDPFDYDEDYRDDEDDYGYEESCEAANDCDDDYDFVRKEAYNYTDPYKYHKEYEPDLEDEEYGSEKKETPEFEFGDVVLVTTGDDTMIRGIVLKTYSRGRFYMVVEGSSSPVKLSTWSKYDVKGRGYFYDPAKDYHATIFSKAQPITITTITNKVVIDPSKNPDWTPKNSTHEYKIYGDISAVVAEYRGTYGTVVRNQLNLDGLHESQSKDYMRRLACFRANLRHRLEIARRLGVGYDL